MDSGTLKLYRNESIYENHDAAIAEVERLNLADGQPALVRYYTDSDKKEISTILVICNQYGDIVSKTCFDNQNDEVGKTWKPTVSAEGELSWVIDDSETAPETVNIKGQKGADGQDGKTWKPTVSAEGELSWAIDDSETAPTSASIKGPQGPKGDTGADAGFGDITATIDSTSSETPTVSVVKGGTNAATTLAFTFSGLKGKDGQNGTPGAAAGFGTITATTDNTSLDSPTVDVTANGDNTAKNITFAFKGLKGKDGNDGSTPTISVGTTNTLNANQSATVTKNGSSTNTNVILDFGIPKGADGTPGADAGFGDITATIDSASSDNPTVEVSTSGDNTAKNITFAFKGLKGKDGNDGVKGGDGKDAGFGTITATTDNTSSDTPTVEVSTSGDNTAKNITFSFKGFKGQDGKDGTGITLKSSADECTEIGDAYIDSDGNIQIKDGPSSFKNGGQVKGPKGDTGESAGFGVITATTDNTSSESPTVEVTANGDNTAKNITFAFSGLKGKDGSDGTTPTISVGTTSTLNASQSATVTKNASSTNTNVILDFGIPKGADGTPGVDAGFGSITATVDSTSSDNPTVEVNTSGDNTAKNITFVFKGIKGKDGQNGANGSNGEDGKDGKDAGFGTITATTDNTSSDTPTVEVTTTGDNTAKNITFSFKGFKGQDGKDGTGITLKSSADECTEIGDAYIDSDGNIQIKDGPSSFKNGGQVKGPQGAPGLNAGFGSITATVDNTSSDTPTVEVTTSGENTAKNIEFAFKGLKGANGTDASLSVTGELLKFIQASGTNGHELKYADNPIIDCGTF